MSTQSFPLIGIDRNGNQHEFEHPGTNARDAAQKAAGLRGFVQVLNNDKGNRLAFYRQPLFKSEYPPRQKSPLALLLEDQLLKTGPAIIAHLRSKGCEVSLIEKHGKTIVRVMPLAVCKVKMDDLDALRNFVKPNTALIVEALRAEAANKQAPETPEEEDVLKGKKQRDIVLAMLPQMPTPFTRMHFIERLKHAGYHAFAANTKKVQNALVYCCREDGEITRDGHGQYVVREQFRHRKHETQATETQIAVEPPAEIKPAPSPTIEPATTVVPSPTVSEPSALNPLLNLLDLASQAASGTEDGTDLAATLTQACEVFESTMLDAVAALTAAVKPIADRLNKQNLARRALVNSLTAVSENQ
jgi:hypothetical protein